MKSAVIIVTYNRLECLKKNLQCIKDQTYLPDKIYVIDNFSTDGTAEFLNNLLCERDELSVIHMSENIGGAGGFYTGIKRAFEDGADWVWGMDDDAYPFSHALENIVLFAEKDSFQNVYWSNCDNDLAFEDAGKIVTEWMFVGFFLTRNVYEKVGLPKKEYFIYHDDVEYAYRIRKAGFKIYKVKGSVISHNGNVETAFYQKKIGRHEIKYPILSDWKHYYYIRNYILRYKNDIKMKLKVILLWMPWFGIKICILNPKMLPKFLKGYIHGILGITGIKEKP